MQIQLQPAPERLEMFPQQQVHLQLFPEAAVRLELFPAAPPVQLKLFPDPKPIKAKDPAKELVPAPMDGPPAKLPVMANAVKAKNFEADYLVAGTPKNGYKYKVKTGTESGEHVGNLHGWKDLQGAKLTSGAAK